MRIALAQLNPTSGDIAGNEQGLLAAMDRARAEGADLFVAPEMAVTGYCIGDQIEEPAFLAANRDAVQRLVARTGDMAVVFGFVEHDARERNEDGRLRKYNAAAVAQRGRLLGVARKSLLPSYRYFDDKRYFTPATRREPIAVKDRDGTVRVGVSICEDMWDEAYRVKPIAELTRQGANVVLNINASPFVPGKRGVRADTIRRHVLQTGRPFVYVNTVGVGDNGKNVIPFDGESLAFDARGHLIHVSPQFREDLTVVDLDLQETSGTPVELPAPTREREVYDALVFSLREYARHCRFPGAVVPVSGGIDSAVALVVAAEAFGAGEVVAYNLPSRFNTETTRALAQRVSHNLGVRYVVVPIQEIDDLVRATFERHAHPIEQRVTTENLAARVRGVVMMIEANDRGRLLISCGNETEVALGYTTLYGDMCGGLSVIGDLSKMDVYRIARHVNERCGREVIPAEMFRIRPSAELSEGQFDPFDYDVTAPLVDELIERRCGPADLVAAFEHRSLDPQRFAPDAEGRTVYDKHDARTFEALVYETYRLLKRAVYKRLQGPPIIVVSERAFGFDLRETIINGWRGRA
jgi:NAD+ synthase (glutamine-hydrolysing)